MPSPVALFVYNRPEHTQKTLDALANNILSGETELFIFADGPRPDTSSLDIKNIEAVRVIIRKEKRFSKINIIESSLNKGLGSSILHGINHVLEKFEEIIVLEDDILTDKYFLKFCNEALKKYKSEGRVMAISGFTFPASKYLPDTFFLSIVACWGWATWKDRWNLFNEDALLLLNKIKAKDKIAEFNFNNSYDYYHLLQFQMAGKVNSWAVRWYASIFLNDGLALYSGRSFTKNIGMDGTGTHYTRSIDNSRGGSEVVISNENFDSSSYFTNVIQTNEKIDRKFQKYLGNIYSKGILDKIKVRIKAILS